MLRQSFLPLCREGLSLSETLHLQRRAAHVERRKPLSRYGGFAEPNQVAIHPIPLSKTGAELLFELISQRYERGSTLITSNLPFEEWTQDSQLITRRKRRRCAVDSSTVARCIEEGLASGQRMAVDASLIEADANKQNSTPKEQWDASTIDPADAPRAVRAYLDTLDEAAFGAASDVQPKFTSHSDPASQCLS